MSHLINAINAAVEAGKAILEVYEKDFDVFYKLDKSPLTIADELADTIINERLIDTFPILSEEGKSIPFHERKAWETFWLVDPLDGTKEFIKKNGEFTVNIALVKNSIPVLGVVFLPVTGVLYFSSKETGSYVYQISDFQEVVDLEELLKKATQLHQQTFPEIYTIVASRSHLSKETEEFIEGMKTEYGKVNLISKGSSIKLCLVAEGKANVYPRIAPTMEWDTAAAHAVAKYAGCNVLDYNTRDELTYNKENLLNPPFIVLSN